MALGLGDGMTLMATIARPPVIAVAVGICSGCAVAQGPSAVAHRPESTSERELHSPLRFAFVHGDVPWCPSRQALTSRIMGPADATWAQVPGVQFTVYVGDVLLAIDLYRVSKQGVTVCLPATGNPRVLIIGPDSKGRPAEFNSSEAEAVR